jgi:uncharacterized protein YdhG (YjbR/CyaY superfamily)
MEATHKKTTKIKEDEDAVLLAIEQMPESDRLIGEKLHTIIMTAAPDLLPRTWYGMPAYSNGNKIVCFFRSSKKFGERFMTLGFNDVAKLDDGNMWPIYYALIKLTSSEETKIAELVKKAAS